MILTYLLFMGTFRLAESDKPLPVIESLISAGRLF